MTLNPASFRDVRRQKFLTERYFALNLKAYDVITAETKRAIQERHSAGDLDPFGEFGLFNDTLNLWKLYYTAGTPIHTLKQRYGDVVVAFGAWHAADQLYARWLAADSGKDLRTDLSPVHLEDLHHYQLALDVVSLGVLLGDGDAVRSVTRWMQSARGTDLLFEALVAPAVADPRDNTDYFHTEPYDTLIDAFYAVETPAEASTKISEYLQGWYKAFEGLPWHDGHLKGTDEYMPYYGYWSFESAAVCVIYGIDDSSFRDHLLYPKDLADWARAHHCVEHLKPGGISSLANAESLRCEAGQVCPRTGWWSTPAGGGSRVQFQSGDTMPSRTSDYGATIWQFEGSSDTQT